MAIRLIDTNIASFLLKTHPLAAVYRPHLDGYTLAVSFQTVAEMLEGAELASWSLKRRHALNSFLASFLTLNGNRTVCEHWAEIRAVRRSQPIPVADCWIAATAVANKLELVTHNPADFAGIPWLTVVTEAP